MSIGAVVVSHESATDLPGCLDALLGAEGLTRVVVVENASTDDSRERVRAAGDDRVELVALETNTGFAGGCNRGFAALGGDVEVVASVNPDVRVAPDCLARAAAALDADDALAGVAPRLMRPGGELVDSVGQVLHRVRLEVRDRGYGEPPRADLMTRRPVLAACGALAVFRRDDLLSVADRHGPWAEHFFCFWEDLELGWRLTNAGRRIDSLPEAAATHSRGAGADAGSGPLRWRRPVTLEACVLTNRWMTLVRHLHPLDLVPRLPVLLIWDALLTGLGAVRRPSLIGAVARRWPLVRREWRGRADRPRRRLRTLPW